MPGHCLFLLAPSDTNLILRRVFRVGGCAIDVRMTEGFVHLECGRGKMSKTLFVTFSTFRIGSSGVPGRSVWLV